MKGQVSTEYLVILTVILVILLIVIYLIGGFSGMGAVSTEKQSKSYWASTAPFAINTFDASGTSLDLELQNNDLGSLMITEISVDGNLIYNQNLTLESGEIKNLTVTMPSDCGPAGIPFTYKDVIITYDKGALMGLKQTGARPLAGKCS